MSHSLNLDGHTILFNSDGSGVATIVEADTGHLTRVPCKPLLMFAARLVSDAKIERLEQMTTEQLLGLHL